MDSTRPIRALSRGLDALTVLNLRDGATVSEIAHEIRLPRTTVYRILETLCNAGFVFRDAADERYRLTLKVRALSEGFDDEDWVEQIAKPCLDELCRSIVWPVCIATLSGTQMMVRESTDHSTPLAVERYSAGFELPLLGSAAGRAFLAHCAPLERDALIDTLSRSAREQDQAADTKSGLLRGLDEVRSLGYATGSRTRRRSEEITIGVPVTLNAQRPAAIGVRFSAAAVPLKVGIDRFLPRLRQCAARISILFSEHQAGQLRTAPQAAV